MEINLTAYLLFMGCSAAACILWFFLCFRRQAGTGKSAALSGLILLLGIALGVFCARLGWLLMRFNAIRWERFFTELFTLRYHDELSYWCGVGGVILGVWLAAKIMKQPSRTVLNAFAPMGAFMAAMARFAEGFLGVTGAGKYIEEIFEEGLFFPLTMEIVWDEDYSEFYLAVFALAGICCLGAMVFALVRKNDRNRLLRTLFYLCLPMILLESLRQQSINWLFVRVEQLLCFLYCEAVLVWYAVKAGAKKLRSWRPAITGLVVCGIVIVGEFALDGKIRLGEDAISHWLIYGVYAAGLIAMAAAEHFGSRRAGNR